VDRNYHDTMIRNPTSGVGSLPAAIYSLTCKYHVCLAWEVLLYSLFSFLFCPVFSAGIETGGYARENPKYVYDLRST
jgi:hypothetical protein